MLTERDVIKGVVKQFEIDHRHGMGSEETAAFIKLMKLDLNSCSVKDVEKTGAKYALDGLYCEWCYRKGKVLVFIEEDTGSGFSDQVCDKCIKKAYDLLPK